MGHGVTNVTSQQCEVSTAPSGPRIHGLDALRGVLMILGVWLHCALAYLPESDWPFTDWTASSSDLNLITDAIHLFRMPAFFLLSGFFGALLWQRRGARAMLKNRLERIVLPFVVFVLLLHPLVAYCFGFGIGVRDHAAVPIDRAWEVVIGEPFPIEGTMHLWFLYDLIYVTAFMAFIVYLVERLDWNWSRPLHVLRRIMESPLLFVVVLGGLNMTWCAIFRWDHIPTEGRWVPEDLTLLSYYFLWYGVGWLLFASRAALASCKSKAWSLVGLGVAATLLRHAIRGYFERDSVGPWLQSLLAGLQEMPISLPSSEGDVVAAHWFLASLGLVAFTRGTMGLFLRYCGSGSPIWRYLSDSAYWVYLIHLPLTVLVPALLLGWEAPVLVKYSASVIIILAVSWLTYDSVIRPTVVGKFLNGRRYPSLYRTYSTTGTLLVMAWLGFGMLQYPPLSDRPPPWRKGLAPSELLNEASVVYPVQPNVRLEAVTHEMCVGVDSYILCVDTVSPEEMEDACAALGSSVAQLKTKAEQERVSQLASTLTHSPFWVAITDEQYEGWFRWPDGTVLSRHAPWHDNEPNNWGGDEHCAALNWCGSVKWNDVGCENRFGFICEQSTVPRLETPEK
ncbi:MAG: hypothetical protein CL930_04560 [Deltaproteobacteria bacterium]|nr:hypothetical protein [Deltaproteobacteria bacterium]